MAFIQAVPVVNRQASTTTQSLSSSRRPCTTSAPSMAVKPKPPSTFSKPDPRTFYVRPDKLADVASLSLGGALRLGSGALIEGYRVRRPSKDETNDSSTTTDSKTPKFEEYSSTLPQTRPAKPLHLFEFEACPFCRKVREAVTMLDLDVIIFPCPKGGLVYRPNIINKAGKAQFPYLEDPNTGFQAYESDDILKYLYETYGPPSAKVPFTLSSAAILSAGLASLLLRPKQGRARMDGKLVPAKKVIEMWGYEASPFSKLVRETLNELEIAHLLHTTPRGSPTRKALKEMTGRIQTPYIIDQNTGINMWESAEICEYLRDTYGPNATGAIDQPTEDDVYMPGDDFNNSIEVEDLPSLDPQPIKDEKLEEYCDDNPDADECRVYED